MIQLYNWPKCSHAWKYMFLSSKFQCNRKKHLIIACYQKSTRFIPVWDDYQLSWPQMAHRLTSCAILVHSKYSQRSQYITHDMLPIWAPVRAKVDYRNTYAQLSNVVRVASVRVMAVLWTANNHFMHYSPHCIWLPLTRAALFAFGVPVCLCVKAR